MATVGSVGGRGYHDCGTEVVFLSVFLTVWRLFWYGRVLTASGEGADRLTALCANRAYSPGVPITSKSHTHPSYSQINGHLHYPNDVDRSLDETPTDKIRQCRVHHMTVDSSTTAV
jgi:hypothetical protein